MGWLLLAFLTLALTGPVHAQDIVDVLHRSQERRLAQMPPAVPGPRADTVRVSFERLRQALPPQPGLELRIVNGPVMAETLHGHIVVANEILADLPEGSRLFILAHELGHVWRGHWRQMGRLYKRWVPGLVTPEQTDPVAGALSRDASRLAYRQEFEADAFALHLLRQLGHPAQEAFSVFAQQGLQRDTPTHPGTYRRLASLRAVDAGVEDPTLDDAD